MVDLSSWKALEYLDLGDTQLGPFPTLPSTIKHLFLNDNPHLHAEPNEIEPAFLPNLETLDCSATFIGPETLKAMTAEPIKGGHLKQLAIGNRLSGVVAVPVEEEFPASESIEDLSLAYLIAPENRTIQTVSLYPNVKRLDVSASKVTGVAVKHFVNMGVKYLNLTECPEVSGDAVEWARGMGVKVEFNFPSRSSRPGAFREVYGAMF
jgi:F-box/TPR repeat protein Pof3